MPLFGELFLSDIFKAPVFDPTGEIVGRVDDVVVVKSEALPKLSDVVIRRRKQLCRIPWAQINLFNKRLISTHLAASGLEPSEIGDEELLAGRDILDKQIVDVNGAKVVRVNDIKLEGHDGDAIVVGVDVGMRGILRRLGFERGSDELLRLLRTALPHNIIPWTYIQPLKPKLEAIALTVPRQMLSDLHPADIAELIGQVSRDEGTHLFKDLDIETAADALGELKPEMQAEILTAIDTERAADIIEEMPPDEAADVLRDLPTEKAKEILEHLEKEEAEDIQELIGHEEDTAGGLMTNEFIAYRPSMTIAEAFARLKQDGREIESVYQIYVVDDAGRLLGMVTLRDMIVADSQSAALGDIMEHKVVTAAPDDDETVVAEKISKYNLVSLPVVDDDGMLVGIVTIDDVIARLVPTASSRKRRVR